MANHPSAEKRIRQNAVRKVRNAERRSHVRTATRKLETAVKNKDKASAAQLLRQAVATIMRARTKGVYHKRTASRKVARLYQLVSRSFQQK